MESFKKKPIPGKWLLSIGNNIVEDIIIVDAFNISDENLKDSYVISGVSFWSKDDIPVFQQFFISHIENRGDSPNHNYEHLFWDQIIYDNKHRLSIEVCSLESSALCEIDSVFDYEMAKLL